MRAPKKSERLELALTLYDRDLLSLGLAAKVAGVSYTQMIDELGRRGIPVVRYSVEDLDEGNWLMSEALLVADSGPLIALARLDLLSLPSHLYGEALVTASVWHEVTCEPWPAERPALLAARDAGLLQVVEDAAEDVPQLTEVLDAGERSAIVLALARRATLLVDEHRGRNAASLLGLRVLGTLGLLVRPRDAGLVARVRPLADALIASDHILARPLIERTLNAIGE